jgi:hypothetical protein
MVECAALSCYELYVVLYMSPSREQAGVSAGDTRRPSLLVSIACQ